MSSIAALRPTPLFLAALAACASPAGRPVSPAPAGALVAAESVFALLRSLRDRIEVADAAGRPATDLYPRHERLRAQLTTRLATIDTTSLSGTDLRAFGIMRGALSDELAALAGTAGDSAPLRPDCDYDARAIAVARGGLDSLRGRIYACYGWAQSHVPVEGDTLDRLTVLGTLGRTDDAVRRRRLFLALEPVWRSIDGDGGPTSPYRTLIALEVGERGGAEPPAAEQARASGVPPDSLERWLLAILETWREGRGDSLIEPWDWYYETGRTSRALSPRIPRDRLLELNREVYGSLGVDIEAIGVHYDLEPRAGKTPVAFATFGGRSPIEPWIFATYRIGGLDNLNELLHETGHAAHIAAIRTRPAFADWPDSDPFAEAVAEFVALDVYEPAWQRHWLGDSVPLADALRARYGGIVLDVAWAVFELRMQRDPRGDANAVWTALTRDYLGIRPHPALSWWAMRGQLVDAPGYMMNYAVGAILIAALRARTRELHGPFVPGDPTWYAWVAPRLFRYGLERPARQVVEEFLGGPVSPAALLADMRRMAGARPAATR